MAAPRLAELTWEDARALGRTGAAAILPVGALEAHGPHLPLETDVIIAEAMARVAAERFAAASRRGVVILPPLVYTPAGFAAGFPGTVSVPPEATTALVTGVAASLARHGFTLLAIANAHLDPGHLAALDNAVREIRAAGALRVAFPDLTRRRLAERLTEEFRSGACHAGRFEGSIVLAERPDLVRDDIRRALAPNPVSLTEATRAGASSFEAAGGPAAYFGAPADATADEGRRSITILGELLDEAMRTELADG